MGSVANELTIEQIVNMLAAAPSQIDTSTAGLTPSQLRAAPAPCEWSANEVLAHLRSVADVRGGYILTILAEDTPTIKAMDPRTYIVTTDYPEQEFEPSFQAYATQRSELVAALQRLAPEDWQRQATVKGAGRPYLKTAQAFAEGIALHERSHLKQIARIARTIRAK